MLAKLLSSKLFHSLLGIFVSLVLVIWLIFAIDWHLVMQHSKNLRFHIIPLLIISLWLHMFFRALRWKYLLPDSDQIPFWLLFDTLMVGNFATYILPLRAGEFIRPFMLSRESKAHLPFATSFTSVVIERFFDLTFVLATFGILVFFLPDLPYWISLGAYALTLLGSAILLFILLGITIPLRLLRLMQWGLKPFPEAISKFFISTAEHFIAGAGVLKNKRNLMMSIFLTFMVWFSNYLYLYVSIMLLPIDNSILLSVTVAVIVALAVAAPSAPGFIGVIQVGCIASFALFGLSKEQATAYAVILHAFQYIFTVLWGVYALSKRGLTLTQLQERKLEPH